MEKEELIEYLKRRDILQSERIIDAFEEVPRENFLPPEKVERAYVDTPVPIGKGQTISAPHMVAHMTELLEPDDTDRVLEIGTGSGYQAAILSKLVDEVVTLEIDPDLYEGAKERLQEYGNVSLLNEDGSRGYAKEAPYDKIIYTAAPRKIPDGIFDQLEEGGILIAPVGKLSQNLKVFRKEGDEIKESTEYGVRFVPLRGEGRL